MVQVTRDPRPMREDHLRQGCWYTSPLSDHCTEFLHKIPPDLRVFCTGTPIGLLISFAFGPPIASAMLGTRIKWARRQRELKQYNVADDANLERARYNHIENNKVGRVFLDELIRIAVVLRCSLDWLAYGGDAEPWPPGEEPSRQ